MAGNRSRTLVFALAWMLLLALASSQAGGNEQSQDTDEVEAEAVGRKQSPPPFLHTAPLYQLPPYMPGGSTKHNGATQHHKPPGPAKPPFMGFPAYPAYPPYDSKEIPIAGDLVDHTVDNNSGNGGGGGTTDLVDNVLKDNEDPNAIPFMTNDGQDLDFKYTDYYKENPTHKPELNPNEEGDIDDMLKPQPAPARTPVARTAPASVDTDIPFVDKDGRVKFDEAAVVEKNATLLDDQVDNHPNNATREILDKGVEEDGIEVTWPPAGSYDGQRGADGGAPELSPDGVPIAGDLVKNVFKGGDDKDGNEAAPFMDPETDEPDFEFTDQYKDNPFRPVPSDAMKSSVEEDTSKSDRQRIASAGLVVGLLGVILTVVTIIHRHRAMFPFEPDSERTSILSDGTESNKLGEYGSATAAPHTYVMCATTTCDVLHLDVDRELTNFSDFPTGDHPVMEVSDDDELEDNQHIRNSYRAEESRTLL